MYGVPVCCKKRVFSPHPLGRVALVFTPVLASGDLSHPLNLAYNLQGDFLANSICVNYVCIFFNDSHNYDISACSSFLTVSISSIFSNSSFSLFKISSYILASLQTSQ